jgi:bifunctional non-homologous end joining protein LigD
MPDGTANATRAGMALAEYRKKRHFNKTSEPAGKVAKRSAARKLSYVIQKHAATRLHYDFRLELDGVLKSWAVPKGPSFDPAEKRLAVEVEDHPIEYAKFEGTIPEGEYGAGEVIVWDRGKWTPIGDPHDGLRRGNLKFSLDGEKLRGEWVLVRLHSRERLDKPNWLLIKHRDEFARRITEYDVTADQPRSVKTGRTLEELAEKNDGRSKVAKKPIQRSVAKRTMVAASSRSNGKPRARAKRGGKKIQVPSGAKKSPLPDDIDVELATLEEAVPTGRQWLHEIKFDGYRLICKVQRGKATLITRRHQNWTHRYQPIAQAAEELPVESAILDGELVALLPTGISGFQALQNAAKLGSDARLVYYAFDLLYLDGYDLRALPLVERKECLRELLDDSDTGVIQYSDHVDEEGDAFFRQACQLGLEGIISKRSDRPYVSGRSGDWIKVKCLGREGLVIGGFTLSTADRRGIGALLVGYFDEHTLIYAGRVGTGFDSDTLLDLRQRLEKLKQDKCPFADVPSKERGPSVKWVRPELVAEIQFGSWTESGILRQPSFQGLREDKAATDVERPASLALHSNGSTVSKKKKTPPRTKSTSSPSAASGLPADLTHPERVLFPDTGLTKLGLANFYAEIGDWILPQIIDRPLSLVRCPEGQAAGKCFFQKHTSVGTPKSLGRVTIEEKEGPGEYVFVEDIEGLLALVQMSVLEVHPWGAKRDNVERPDRLTIDLDPGTDVPWPRVVDAAFQTRDLLTDYGLESFVKTTGGKGLHVVVPISPRRAGWDEAKRFCKHVAGQIADAEPKHFTINMAKAARKGKIFVDYLRNDRGATAVAAYSTRAKPGATVSTPVAWDELSAAIHSDHFNVANLPARLKSLKHDPWAKIDGIRQGIPRVG